MRIECETGFPMSADLEALLRAALSDPSRLRMLPLEQVQALVAGLRAVVGGEQPPLPTVVTAATPGVATPAWTGDDLLTADEAAGILKVSVRWMYRHARTLPFTRKLSRKVLRFSRSGLARWLATKRL